VSGYTEFDVEVVRDLDIDGPLLLPNEEDLSHISKPYSDEEIERGQQLGAEYGVDVEADMGPIQIIGTGATINDATENAYDRAATLLGMSEGEIRTRCTFTGGVEIGRLPGVVQLTMLAPMDVLEDQGLAHLARDQYDL
jgi:formamidase